MAEQPIDVMRALFGIEVDQAGLDKGLAMAERKGGDFVRGLASQFSGLSTLIVGGITVGILAALEKITESTGEWAAEMNQLAGQMGMTAKEASTMVGVMERFGVNQSIAARSMAMLTHEMKVSSDAIDPFNTRLGKLLGSMRDSSGNAISLGEALEIARKRVAEATTETEKLQVAQQLFGIRMGGRMLPALKMAREEFERLKVSVGEAGVVIDEETSRMGETYEQTMSQFKQELRGLSLVIGEEFLPTLLDSMKVVNALLIPLIEFPKNLRLLRDAARDVNPEMAKFYEKIQDISMGVLKAMTGIYLFQAAWSGLKKVLGVKEKEAEAAPVLAPAPSPAGGAAGLTPVQQKAIVDMSRATQAAAREMQRAEQIGLVTYEKRKEAVGKELVALAAERALIEDRLKDPGLKPDTRMKLENDLLKLQITGAETVAGLAEAEYKQEELQLKAIGALGIENEIKLLAQRLEDENIMGDAKLRIQEQIYQKTKQYAEESLKIAKALGFAGAEDEISFRRRRAAEELGKGNIQAAAKEAIAIKDISFRVADEQMEFMKKLRTVSLSDEIEFQQQKLAIVKGNAEEEMKILGQIADLDKQRYDQRLQYALNYVQNVQSDFEKMNKAISSKGPVESWESARRRAEVEQRDVYRQASIFGQFGGTQEQRAYSVQVAQGAMQQYDSLKKMGQEIPEQLGYFINTAKDILKRATGGMEIQKPGEVSPVVGSLTSPAEGLATSNLARGTEIPRLDTSFTDLAIRIRDVMLGAIPNVQSFSDAMAAGTRKILGASAAGIAFPGGAEQIQRGVPLTTGPSALTPAPFGSVPGGAPAGGGSAAQVSEAVLQNKDAITKLAGVVAEIPASLRASLDEQIKQFEEVNKRMLEQLGTAGIKIEMDENTGVLSANLIKKTLVSELR